MEFLKTYDKVSWRFPFLAMEKIGIHARFISWVKIYFLNACVAIDLNGKLGNNFKIERIVWQGCPLAPYMCIIVGKVLTHNIKKAFAKGMLKGISLCISQYTNDYSFIARGDKITLMSWS